MAPRGQAALQQLDLLWDDLFPAEQAIIVALLIERLAIGTEGLYVWLRVDGLTRLPVRWSIATRGWRHNPDGVNIRHVNRVCPIPNCEAGCAHGNAVA